MDIFGKHLMLLDDAQHAIVKKALADAGHDLVSFAGAEAAKAEAIIIGKYPALVAAFEEGFETMKNSTLDGYAKMESIVVNDVLPKLPELASELTDVAGVKDVLLGVGQVLFVDTVSKAKADIGKLVAAVV